MKRLIILTAVLSLCLTGFALATVKVKPGRYSGHIANVATDSVSLTVSGGKVTKVRVGTFVPNTCGGGGPAPKQTSAPASISHGSFKATVDYSATMLKHGVMHSVTQTAIVTGTFLAGGREKGTVSSGKGIGKMCVGHFAYSTKHT